MSSGEERRKREAETKSMKDAVLWVGFWALAVVPLFPFTACQKHAPEEVFPDYEQTQQERAEKRAAEESKAEKRGAANFFGDDGSK